MLVTEVPAASVVCSAYWLFWQRKTTGSFQTDAMLSASWNAPILLAPSPKLATATRFSPLICAAIARPLSIGMPDPTIPVVPITTVGGYVICIGQPLPLQVDRQSVGWGKRVGVS